MQNQQTIKLCYFIIYMRPPMAFKEYILIEFECILQCL